MVDFSSVIAVIPIGNVIRRTNSQSVVMGSIKWWNHSQMLCIGLVMVLVANASSTRCYHGMDEDCLLYDLSADELSNDFDFKFDAKSISIVWSEIPDFPSEIKTSSRFKDVEKIELSLLKIRNVRKIKFSNVNALYSIDLSNNYIDVFEFASTVTSLELSDNQITTIHDNAFNGLTKLETLELMFNQIKQIDSKMCLPIPQLGELILSFNRITDIENVEFPTGLRSITLCFNNIDKGLSNVLTLKNLSRVNVIHICAKSANPNCCTERKMILKSLTERNVKIVEDFFDDCPEDE